MLRSVRNWVVVIGLVLATGGHWAALQSVAWVGMAIQFTQSDDLQTALRKTFDGNHPCSLCKVVQEGRKAQKQQAAVKMESKVDFFLSVAYLPIVGPEFGGEKAPPLLERDHSRVDAPPTPPPRSV